ncbi:tetratricopeptide repeat protein [Neobacillus sp. LXY-4]|uniref:tetratricopeptide repeat protein n=1 Tax=Neobacillus sp. LXY-4 TaxID=3379826 RepID=UPI003EDF701D
MSRRRVISKKHAFLIMGGYVIILFFVWIALNQYFIQRNPQLALVQEYKNLVKEDPENPDKLSQLGKEYLQMFEQTQEKSYLNKAKQLFWKALKLSPNNTEYRLYLADTLALLKDQSAMKQYKQVLKQDPLNLQANYELALYYGKNKNYDQAIVHFKNCLEIEPTAADVYFELGEIYEKMNDQQNASLMYAQTKKYDPLFTEVDKKLNQLIED